MTEKNHIRLTDKFIIERTSKEITTFMTVDGHDLQDFVLELQSDFTSDAELQLQTLENGLIALNFDLVTQKEIESTHYNNITTAQDNLQRQLVRISINNLS